VRQTCAQASVGFLPAGAFLLRVCFVGGSALRPPREVLPASPAVPPPRMRSPAPSPKRWQEPQTCRVFHNRRIHNRRIHNRRRGDVSERRPVRVGHSTREMAAPLEAISILIVPSPATSRGQATQAQGGHRAGGLAPAH
jgi:hypothetical protein